MNIATIADEIRRELGDSNTLSTPSISFWLKGHIGDLNNLIGTSYEVSADTTTVTPELGEQEKSIFKKLFNIYFYETQIRQFLGAASQDIVLEVSSDGGTVRTVNKNEISKNYITMNRMEKEALKDLVNGYLVNGVSPMQVAGDDTIAACNSLNSRSYLRD